MAGSPAIPTGARRPIFASIRAQAHTPPAQLRADGARRIKAPEDNFVDDDNAREAKKLAARGVPVSIGAHGQQAGIGAHWELWSFVRGGGPRSRRCARDDRRGPSLGMARDIGSLELGKLADLVVLDADPTQDIRNSDKINRVMLSGRLYDPVTPERGRHRHAEARALLVGNRRRASPARRARRRSRANARPYSRRRHGAGWRRDARRRCAGEPASVRIERRRERRQHQARLRLTPSRWAILPSERSETKAGVNRLRGSPCGEIGQEGVEPGAKSSRGRMRAHAQGLGQRRGQEVVAARLPGLAGPVAAIIWRARSRISAARPARWRSAHSSARISAKAVLKWVPTRIG